MSEIISRPVIRIDTKYKCLHINHATHDAIGKPPYFEFFWCDEKKTLLIAPQSGQKTGCYKVSEKAANNRNREIRLRSMHFFTMLIRKFDMKYNESYKVFGEYIPGINMVAFQMADLLNAEVKNEDGLTG